MADEQKIIQILRKVKDPELNVDIYTLELIRGIKEENNKIIITMTLTSPACPFGPEIIKDVKTNVSREMNKKVLVELTFNPPWEPSEDLREELMSSH
ncbi:metal-sulfur cluster assembly factor [Candidatus Woesearchaeota archaeon]|nr:metal-sulfur cluster assembly factor [Candidatus Woesearchaeota archaeon]